MTQFWRDPRIVSKVPLATTFLLESANAGQMHRMWTEHTAAGQSLVSWASVCLALILWLQFYRIITPEQKIAKWATVFGICMNLGVIGSVVFFRYVV